MDEIALTPHQTVNAIWNLQKQNEALIEMIEILFREISGWTAFASEMLITDRIKTDELNTSYREFLNRYYKTIDSIRGRQGELDTDLQEHFKTHVDKKAPAKYGFDKVEGAE